MTKAVRWAAFVAFGSPRRLRYHKSLSKQTFTLRYLSKTAIGVPRDLAKTAIAQFRPIRPTVLIFNCTFVCDARCTMCSNWKRGKRRCS